MILEMEFHFMDFLFEGVKNFSKNEYRKYRSIFKELGKSQNPHTLFIGCSDSRVVPDLITTTLPGELFVVRNIANVVPNYRLSEEFLATTSAIEYAVNKLEVENIVVCGHSNCGGCKEALNLNLDKNIDSDLPHTEKWLTLLKNPKEKAYKKATQLDAMEDIELIFEQENIVEQMNHLLSYPFIKSRYKDRKIKIFGWYYEITTGKVFNYNINKRVFEEIK